MRDEEEQGHRSEHAQRGQPLRPASATELETAKQDEVRPQRQQQERQAGRVLRDVQEPDPAGLDRLKAAEPPGRAEDDEEHKTQHPCHGDQTKRTSAVLFQRTAECDPQQRRGEPGNRGIDREQGTGEAWHDEHTQERADRLANSRGIGRERMRRRDACACQQDQHPWRQPDKRCRDCQRRTKPVEHAEDQRDGARRTRHAQSIGDRPCGAGTAEGGGRVLEELPHDDQHEAAKRELSRNADRAPTRARPRRRKQRRTRSHEIHEPRRAQVRDQPRQERHPVALVVGQGGPPEFGRMVPGDEPARVVDRHQDDDQATQGVKRREAGCACLGAVV